MPSIHAAFPSAYLRALDLGDHRVAVTISHLKMEDVAGDGERKPVLYFQGKEKGMVLNKTNANTVVDLAGTDDYDKWNGVKLRLFATTTDFKGKTVPCIRLEGGVGQKPQPKPEPEPEPDGMSDDDSVPF